MQMISNWLKGNKNYTVGKHLYNLYGQDANLKKLLQTQPETPFTRQQLAMALQQILDKGTRPTTPLQTAVLRQMPAGDTEILKALEKEWKLPYKQMVHKQHQLQAFGKDNSMQVRIQCKELAMEILELEQQIMKIWDKRDYYLQHNRLPEVPDDQEDELPTDPLKLGMHIQNIARYIRRHKANMDKHPDKPQYAQLYEDYKNKYQKATGNAYSEKN